MKALPKCTRQHRLVAKEIFREGLLSLHSDVYHGYRTKKKLREPQNRPYINATYHQNLHNLQVYSMHFLRILKILNVVENFHSLI